MIPVTLDPDRLDRTQLPLYDRLIIEFAGPERRSAEGKWLTGTIIHFVRENDVYKDHGFQTDPQWIKATFPFDVDQAHRYVQIAEQGVTEAMLTKAARSGKAHLMLHKNVEVARAHVLAVDLCPEEQLRQDGLLDRPGRSTETPAATKSSDSENAGLPPDKAGSTSAAILKSLHSTSTRARTRTSSRCRGPQSTGGFPKSR